MPAPKVAVRREQFATRAQNAQEQGRAELTKAINRCPFLSPRARLISVSLTAATDTVIKHGLGVPAAFTLARPNYNGTTNSPNIIESASQSGVDINNQLSIRASATCVVDLWFYPRASQLIPTGAVQSP